MDLLLRVLQLLFSMHKCLVYTAIGFKEYLQIVNKLETLGISYRTVTRYNLLSPVRTLSPRDYQNVSYDIYVKKVDEYKAHQAIHDRSV